MVVKSAGRIPRYLQAVFDSGVAENLGDGTLLERFRSAGDQAAFEAIVARHGPMVLRVCRAALSDPNDAGDAFQAVFLVLVRRAGSIRTRDSLASWLFGVATRVSTRARTESALRRKHERRAAESRPRAARMELDEPDGTIAALHEELARLPDRYREPVVLCYLEGQTCDAAARRLKRPVGTIKARLSRARRLLEERLHRRGIEVPAGLITPGAIGQSAAAPVPGKLAGATSLLVTRPVAAPVHVISLAEGVMKAMVFQRLAIVVASALVMSFAAGTLVAVRGTSATPATPQAVKNATENSSPKQTALTPTYMIYRQLVEEALPAATAAADPYFFTFALIDLAKAQHALGDLDGAFGTLRRANTVAETVKNEHLRRLAVMRTAVRQGKMGDTAPARATLEHYAREAVGLGSDARYNLMSMVIDFQFQAGLKDEAKASLNKEMAFVESIADEELKDGGIYRLLFNQLTLRDYDGALRQVARYKGKRSNLMASLLGEIVRYPSTFGDPPSRKIVERALELTGEVTYPYPQAMAFREIAVAFARAGDIDRGLQIARDIADTREFSIRSSEIPLALVEIARLQAKAGQVETAKKTLREAFGVADTSNRRDLIHASRVRRVAEAQAEIGDVDGAKASVAAIEGDSSEKAVALAALAKAQAKAGDRSGAQASLREAFTAAQGLGPREDLINDNPAENARNTYRTIALAQAETGDAKGAIETLVNRGNAEWRSENMTQIATIQARQGDISGALATARLIPVPTRAGEAYSSIASLQAKAGDVPGALTWAPKLDSPIARAFGLIGIIDGLAAATTGKPAQGAGQSKKR
jgi:RNA polymerase sigma factor (sigma-70 family)